MNSYSTSNVRLYVAIIFLLVFIVYIYVGAVDWDLGNEGHALPPANYIPLMHPRVQNCKNDTTRTIRVTKTKTLTCTLFKDEVGFLAEFIAFYKMQGVDHMILFDHDSLDNFTAEVAPWVTSGFVSLRDSSELIIGNGNINDATKPYWKVMNMKKRQEMLCMLWGMENNYDYHISVDIDEYLFTERKGRKKQLLASRTSAVDSIHTWFMKNPNSGVLYIRRAAFTPVPHFLEPIDLLTVEAYQTRYPDIGRVNFYMSTQPKVVYKISDPNYTNASRKFLLNCCGFHGCELRREWGSYCTEVAKTVGSNFGFDGKHFNLVSHDHHLQMNHYARSLEKFSFKQMTWETASSHGKNEYDVNSYLHRSYGWTHDSFAAELGCAIREEINKALYLDHEEKDKSSIPHYIRSGEEWFRNVEFGRSIKSASRRGRGNGQIRIDTPRNEYKFSSVQKKIV